MDTLLLPYYPKGELGTHFFCDCGRELTIISTGDYICSCGKYYYKIEQEKK